jgi:anaerobic selenocysteine-containing dehydrogenase
MDEVAGSFELPAYDWASARYVLSLEAGLLEDSCQMAYLARLTSQRQHGPGNTRSTIVHAGSAYDLSAHNGDEWIRLTPGSSGAFALGLCRELLTSERYDRVAASAQIANLEAFAEAVQAYTPERVAELSTVPPETTRRIARELWDKRPSFAFIDDRSTAFSNGRETALATLALNSLLGALEAPDGGVRVAARAPLRAWPPAKLDERAKTGRGKPRLDRAGSPEFPRARSIHETLVEAIEKAPPEIAFLYYSNPAYARHQPARWRAALAKIPMVVSFSPFYDETVDELAHLVLPDHSYLERFEDATPAPALSRPVIGVRKPVVVPLHDTRSTGDVILDLSRRIGGTVAESMPWQSFHEAVDARLLGLHDSDRGTVRAPSEREFLETLYDEAVWADSGPPPVRSLRFELSAAWSEPSWAGDESEFPLKLMLYRPLGHAVGSGANQPWLHQLRTRPGARPWEQVALVHPRSAAGASNGDQMRIASAWGEVVMPIRLEPRMAVGCVAISMGRGHTALGRFAKGMGVNAMTLVAPGAAPTTGASVLCGTRVKLSKGAAHG